MKTEYSNTKTYNGWNYTRMTEHRSVPERIRLAAEVLRHGVLELEFFWKGEEVYIDAVSLRFGERTDRMPEHEEVPDEAA